MVERVKLRKRRPITALAIGVDEVVVSLSKMGCLPHQVNRHTACLARTREAKAQIEEQVKKTGRKPKWW
jgi:hypothetical protein